MDFKTHPGISFTDIDKLSNKEADEEVNALREGIHYHDYLYYINSLPKIADRVYDKLFQWFGIKG